MTEMHRRDFVKHLALLTAGAAALPQQIGAFENYYNLNTSGVTGLAAMDEIMISGRATKGLAVDLDLWVAGENRMPMALNLFGGILRWVASPLQMIVAPADKISWRIKPADGKPFDDVWLKSQFRGHISFIGQDGIRRNVPLLACKGTLA